jgi:hypothetical protein
MDGVLQESREGLAFVGADCKAATHESNIRATTNDYSTPALAAPATEPRHLCIAFAGRPTRLLRGGNARTAFANSMRNHCVPIWDNDPAEKILLIFMGAAADQGQEDWTHLLRLRQAPELWTASLLRSASGASAPGCR